LSKDLQNKILFQQVVELLQNARLQVLRTVNQTMTITYFEIGRMIIEEEQNGKDRAEYGKQILKGLSQQLTNEFGKGFSVENLDRMRKFYQTYSISSTLSTIFNIQKAQAVTAELRNSKAQSLISFL
jgi:predicted GNAT family N-acyltransferase